MFTDTFLIGWVRLGQSLLLVCALASGVTLAAEDTYNCIPMASSASSTDYSYFNQVGSNQLTASPAPTNTLNPPNTADNFYIVQKGDTLYAVMRKTGVPIKNLMVLNQLPPLHNLKAGQSLRLPDIANIAQPMKQPEISAVQHLSVPTEVTSTANISFPEAPADQYVVRVGDTLYAIARQTGVSIERLVSLNQLTTSNNINAGQPLRLR